MLVLYSLALSVVLAVSAPYWLLRMAATGKYREGLMERLGRIPPRVLRAPGGAAIWVHAVSVGEVIAATRLIEELRSQAGGRRIVISTTTRTGQSLARERFGAENVFYFPLDFAFAVRAWLRALRPEMLVLLETEFWPRMLVECRRAGIPVAVINARISDRSWPRYRRLRFAWRRLLRSLRLVMAQSELDRERLVYLGAGNVRFGGNLKYDIRVREESSVAKDLRSQLQPGAQVLVCGSTLEGEEEMLLGVIPTGGVTILAPRHPERFEPVAQLLQRSGKSWVRRSQWSANRGPIAADTVFLLDSIGELASVYSLATVAFVGGSLVPAGGHNPLEPAQFAVPVLMGPHFENFRNIVESLQYEHAIRIAPPEKLKAAFADLLENETEARAMGERARTVCEREAGATERAVRALLQIVEAQA